MLDPFGYDTSKLNIGRGYDFSKKPVKTKFLVDTIKPQFVKDEKGNITGDTVGEVVGQEDLEEVIRSYKDQTGMEYIMREVASGRRSLDSLADDVRKNGDFGGDFTRPTMIAEAYPLMQQDAQNAEHAKQLAASLGITVEELLKTKDFNALVKEKLGVKDNAQKEQEGDNK